MQWQRVATYRIAAAQQRKDILLKGVNDLNKLQIFSNPEFGSIRTLDEDGKVLFAATDVAKALGYRNPHDAISKHCKGVAKREALTNGGVQELNFIPEGDVYRLITHSNLPDAEEFERWLFDDMLPTLRKTGSYSIVQADPNLPPELAMVEGLLNSMKQMYSTQQRHDKAIEQLTESMDTMKEVMTTDVNGDWRTACGHAIQAVARKLGGGKAYEEAWNEVYTEMERNGFFVRRRLENRKKSAAAQGMSPTYVRKLNALDIIADSKDKKLMSAFINATKKLAAAHSVRMDRLNELPAVEEQPEQTAFDRTCAPAGKLIDTRDAAIRG